MNQMDLMDQMDDFTFYGNAEKSILSIRFIGSIRCFFCDRSMQKAIASAAKLKIDQLPEISSSKAM